MNRKYFVTIIILIICMFQFHSTATAQDTHYWTYQYGMRAELLGGVTVGSVLDISTMYYNPGALVLIDSASVLTSTFNFDISTYSLEEGAGEGNDISNTKLTTLPSFVAGMLPTDSDVNVFSYILLTRQEADIKIRAYDIDPYRKNNTEFLASELFGDSKMKETWAGFTWSRKLGESIGFGLSNYFALRTQNSRFQTIKQQYNTVNEPGTGEATILVNEFDYWNLRLLWKAGWCFDYTPWTFGFTITTPSINLFGNGSTFANVASTDPSEEDTRQSGLASNSQEDMGTTYNSSLAAAFGTSFRFTDTVIHATVEWFDSVDPFDVMDTEPFQAQSSGETFDVNVTHELKSITNFGIGIEHQVNEKLGLYGSFITDFSAFEKNSNISIIAYDIYHINFGAAFSLLNTDLTLGIGYGWGSQTAKQMADLRNLSLEDVLGDDAMDANFTYRNLRIIFGFSI